MDVGYVVRNMYLNRSVGEFPTDDEATKFAWSFGWGLRVLQLEHAEEVLKPGAGAHRSQTHGRMPDVYNPNSPWCCAACCAAGDIQPGHTACVPEADCGNWDYRFTGIPEEEIPSIRAAEQAAYEEEYG